MDHKIYYVIIGIIIVLVWWYMQTKSQACPPSNICYDCAKFQVYGPASLRVNTSDNVLDINIALKVCEEMKDCKGVLTVNNDNTKGIISREVPSNAGSSTTSVFYEKKTR